MAISLEESSSARTLEKKVDQLGPLPETERVEHCLYCNEKIDSKNHYQPGPEGSKYCSKNCFDLFTDC